MNASVPPAAPPSFEGWGGPGAPQKRTWLASVIVDAFEETVPTPDDQYVEEILLQVLADEFETNIEDGSAEVVALDIVRLWDETRIGRDELVIKFESKAEGLRGKRMAAQELPSNAPEEWEGEEGDEDEDDSGMDEDEEVPQLIEPRQREEPEIDEDGFTLVKGKGKSHR
ncbi:Pre-rRNA-processing protein TSR2 [Mycena sanguinolenta]|uniref:Pre-rRNA-processing protein TSR2 n=1 Tax=Mycena sanguinolenta TaxID=230812 RepID=A0A8H7CXX0_9AGAR|nr:Pre-rRNA-processing protein TSR2 [Mycena sanguinolenta]